MESMRKQYVHKVNSDYRLPKVRVVPNDRKKEDSEDEIEKVVLKGSNKIIRKMKRKLRRCRRTIII
jgi:hypothetical protein